MPAAPPSRWKRRIRRILAALLLSPFLLLALANVILATPWARGCLGRKLSTRLGVETMVGQATCTPWGGFAIGDLQCLQPPPLRDSLKAPLLEIREIRAYPRWARILRGELALSSVRIDRPRLALSLEMAASMAAAGTTTPAPTTTSPPVVSAGGAPPAKGGNIPPASNPPKATPAPPLADSSIVGTAWVEVLDAGAELWLSGARVASFRGIEGKIPFAGAPAFSKLQLHELEVLGQVLGRDLAFPLSWRAPELRSEAPDLRLAELQVKLAVAVGVMPGTPFAIDLSVPQQAAHAESLLPRMRPTAAKLEVRLQALGLMRHPSSWQGIAAAAAETVTMQFGTERVAFDEGRATLALQGGVLQCPEIRLTGERVSFLGNGQFRGDGQGTGVLRVVVPPATAATWAQRLTIDGKAPVFAPLETPDRIFIDLRWISYSGGQGIELGAGGPIVPAGDLAKLFSGS
jgi:hypothetical protein